MRPELVCEVEFEEWTRDGLLRHSAYKGLSDDKPAAAARLVPASRCCRLRRVGREDNLLWMN